MIQFSTVSIVTITVTTCPFWNENLDEDLANFEVPGFSNSVDFNQHSEIYYLYFQVLKVSFFEGFCLCLICKFSLVAFSIAEWLKFP